MSKTIKKHQKDLGGIWLVEQTAHGSFNLFSNLKGPGNLKAFCVSKFSGLTRLMIIDPYKPRELHCKIVPFSIVDSIQTKLSFPKVLVGSLNNVRLAKELGKLCSSPKEEWLAVEVQDVNPATPYYGWNPFRDSFRDDPGVAWDFTVTREVPFVRELNAPSTPMATQELISALSARIRGISMSAT